MDIKDSTNDEEHTKMLNKLFPSLDVYSGSEKYLLDYLNDGGASCITGTMNITARLASCVRDALGTSDAEALQKRLSQV